LFRQARRLRCCQAIRENRAMQPALKLPASYRSAHSHPTDENVVILSGALTFGWATKLGARRATRRRAWRLRDDAGRHESLRLHDSKPLSFCGIGRDFDVNPADDPRTKK
jgi:hypothetical protein